MEAARAVNWKPLGELLVEHGLLSVSELEDALGEQERTGQRLGAILVERRIIAGAVLKTILAEQVGMELEKQSGFGSGLFAKIARRNGGEPSPPQREPVLHELPVSFDVFDDPTPRPGPLDPAVELVQLRADLELERARVAQLEEELALLRAKPKRKPAAKKPAAATTPAAATKPAAKKPAAKKALAAKRKPSPAKTRRT